MQHRIYGRMRQQVVVFVGCTRTSDIPDDCVILQIVEHRPEVHWVKWCLRFRRALTDTKALDHPFAAYFKNSARVRRLCGDEDLSAFPRI
jgi:hypothetical protein